MRYRCQTCGKSVSSEIPDDSVIRAVLTCPECIEAGRVVFPEERKHDWNFYVNGIFCTRCGVQPGSNQPCR